MVLPMPPSVTMATNTGTPISRSMLITSPLD